jgi:DNA-binding beta-propeller fold protein YncE
MFDLLFVEVVILYYSLSVISVKVSSCARWNKTGITVPETSEYNGSTSHLLSLEDIFIHNRTNVLYVLDSLNSRILMFSLDKLQSPGITAVSTETKPDRLFVDDDDDGPTIYVSLLPSERVEKWIKNASLRVQVGGSCVHQCRGVSVDKEKNVYIVESSVYCVKKWSPRSENMTIVAGQRGRTGPADKYLKNPGNIYVDQNTESVFVADTYNHRIQK